MLEEKDQIAPAVTSDSTPGAPVVPSMAMAGSDVILRWTIIGGIVGFFLIGGLFGAAIYAFGGGLAGAIAVGLFTGVMGGPGFGGMMGFVVQYAKYNEHDIG